MLATVVLSTAVVTSATASPTAADCDAAGHATVLQPAPEQAPLEARAIWLDARLLRWPGVAAGGHFRLHRSASGRAVARPGTAVTGADGALDLEVAAGAVPPAVAARFRHVATGVTLQVQANAETLRELHREQLLLVQEDADGRVLYATRLQSPGLSTTSTRTRPARNSA